MTTPIKKKARISISGIPGTLPRTRPREALAYSVIAPFLLGATYGIARALSAEPAAPMTWLIAGALATLFIAPVAQIATRDVRRRFSVVAAPGRLVHEGGEWIAARDVQAVSTGRLPNGGVSIGLKVRQAPAFFFAVDNDEDAERVLNALGAAKGGSGAELEFDVVWQPAPTPRAESALALLAFALPATFVAFRSTPIELIAALMLFVIAAFMGVLRLKRWGTERSRSYDARGDTLRLGRSELHLVSGSPIAYRDIRTVQVTGEGFRIVREDSSIVEQPLIDPLHPSRAIPMGVLDHLLRHVLSAAARAHGPTSKQLDTPRLLLPLTGDPTARLSQLDALAERVEQGSTTNAYREEVLPAEDIAAVLEDAGQPVVLRASAARVLLRAGAVDKTHVADVLAALHGEGMTERARVVAGLDKATQEETAQALDELEEHDGRSEQA